MITRHHRIYCPGCKHQLDSVSDLRTENKPKAGDLSICIYCYMFLELTEELIPIELTAEKFALMDVSVKAEMTRQLQFLKQNPNPFYDLGTGT